MLIFTRDERPTPMDGMVVCYKLQSGQYDGQISASRNGVMVSGNFPLLTRANCRAFAEQLERAVVHHRHLADSSTEDNLTEAEVDAFLATAEPRPKSNCAKDVFRAKMERENVPTDAELFEAVRKGKEAVKALVDAAFERGRTSMISCPGCAKPMCKLACVAAWHCPSCGTDWSFAPIGAKK